ncbi:MAG TPA: CHASE2 domain-containing protein [Azospira sp.]|nr:CHASE2 domain-containing protein [Azospira sp.]
MTETHSEEQTETHIPLWAHVLICVIVGYLLSLLWGRINQFEEAGVRVAGRLTAPLVGKLAYGKGHRDQISLLLLGDEDLQRMGSQWPIPYSVHGDMLRTLAQYKPKAVMLDILFLDKRKDGSIGELVDALCDLQRQGIRVYLAALPKDGKGEESWEVRPELRRCATLVAVPKDEDFLDNQTWSYDLRVKENPDHPTAAMAMYRDAVGLAPDSPLFEEPIGLVWGADSDPESDKRQRECREISVLTPLLHPVASILGEEHGSAICGFHPVVSGAVLLNGEDETYLKHALTGRYVFYGASLTGASDIAKSPIQGSQPGSTVHAMALDNLLTYGPSYKKSLSPDGRNRSDIFVLLCLFLIAALKLSLEQAYRYRTKPHDLPATTLAARLSNRLLTLLGWIGENRDDPKSRLAYLHGLAARMLIVVLWLFPCGIGLAYIGYQWFDLAPMTWITFALFPILLEFEEATEKVMKFRDLDWR